MSHISPVIGASLLIAGTSIGAAMLALPVELSAIGFLPAVGLCGFVWLMMMFSALLMLEVNLHFESGTNLITMASKTLGKVGKSLALIAYLFLLYCLLAAYISGLSDLVSSATSGWFQKPLYTGLATTLAISLFAMSVFLGSVVVDRVNRLFVLLLMGSFCVFAVILMPYIHIDRLLVMDKPNHWLSLLPIVIVAFGYQIIIPSLRTLLHSQVSHIRTAILLGGSIPLVAYLVWILLVIGALPLSGTNGLMTIWQEQSLPTGLIEALSSLSSNTALSAVSGMFTLFALSTSLLGVSLSLFDFLMDGLMISKQTIGRFSTLCLTFLPPCLFAIVYPQGFSVALRYGAIFVAVLLGILPAIMALRTRAIWPNSSLYRVKGGRIVPLSVCLFSGIVILMAL